MGEDTPVIAHEWRRIADLPENWRDLCRHDLHAVHRQWVADRAVLHNGAKLRKFEEALAVRWAVETGIIERLYAIDRGVTVQIAQAGMEALGQFHARGLISADARALITDQRAALDMVMDLVGGQREMTAFYIKELQHQLTRSQETCDAEDQFGNTLQVPLLRGEWKRQPNNPRRPDGSIHEYCPPEFVQDEIEQLLAWREEHAVADVCPEVEAAWLHHRFAQIHPFQDGNGRVARALTGAVFLKADYLVLVVRDDEHRERYLDALEAADADDLKPLVDLFANIQIADLQAATKSVRELRGETIMTVSHSLAERARRRKEASRERTADVLENMLRIALARLLEAAGELRQAFARQDVAVTAMDVGDDADRREWWARQTSDAARAHGYEADLDRPRRWVALRLGLPEIERRETSLVISLHAVRRTADLHAATAFLSTPLASGEGASRWEDEVVAGDPFRFGAEMEQLADFEGSFRAWLDETIGNGLSAWGERL